MSSIDNFLIEVFWLLILLSRIIITGNYLFVIIEILFGVFVIFRNSRLFFSRAYWYIAISSSICLLLSFAFSKNFIYKEHTISIIFYLPAALLLSKGQFSFKKISKFCLIVEIFLLIMGLFWGYERLFSTVSRNSVSAFLLLFILPLIIIFDKEKQKELYFYQLLIHAVLIFLNAILAVGRGGILSTGFFLLGLLFYYFSGLGIRKTVLDVVKEIVLIIVMFGVLAYFLSFPDRLSILFSRFFERTNIVLAEEPRMIIYKQYWEASNDIKSFFFGPNIEDIPLLNIYNSNPHNSFLNIHKNYGFVWLSIILWAVISDLFINLKRRNFLWIIYVLTIMIRSFTDSLAGGAMFDIIFFYIIMKTQYRSNRAEYI